MPRTTLLFLCLVCLCSVTVGQQFRLDVARVRPVLSSIMRCQNFSSLRVAVVQAGSDAQTLRLRLNGDSVEEISPDDGMLQIGSVSKGMFGTALPLIQQRLRNQRRDQQFQLLTTPLKQLLGDGFWFLDHGRTEQVTLEDLVSHTSGLDSHDSVWMLREATTVSDIARLASRLQPRLPFRASYLYNNLAFTVADAALQRLTGQTFAQYMRTDLWQPLGMNRTRSAAEMRYPDTDLSKSLELVEAAGGIVLPLDDMIKYLQYHIRNYNFSNTAQLPKYFSPVNAHPADVTMAFFFSSFLLADNVTNIPDWNFHNYGYGWMKSHYRDRLNYYHGGAYFSARTELDLFVKQNLAVFTNAELGSGVEAGAQSLYVNYVNKYVADLLLQNDSFLAESSPCSLLKQMPVPTSVLPLRQLSDADVAICTGRFGNYGFGSITVAKDASSGDLTAQYGIGRVQLIPVQRPGAAGSYHFFAIMQSPQELSNTESIASRNSSHIAVKGSVEQSLLTITSAGSVVNLSSAALQAGLVMQKGLDPATWERPQLCPQGPKAAASLGATFALQLLAALVAAVVAAAL